MSYYFVTKRIESSSNDMITFKNPTTFEQIDSMLSVWNIDRIDKVEEWDKEYDHVHLPAK